MGKISTIERLSARIPSHGMAWLGLAAIVAAALLSTGCGKSKSSTAQAPAPPPAADSQTPAAALPQAPQYTSAPDVITASPEGGADLKQLNHAYIGWVLQNRRRPNSFEEFVTQSGVKVPPPPAGKKYVIDKYGFINVTANN
jgi:hypothetical protein